MPGVSRSNRTARDYLRITPADVPCSLKPTHASNLKCVIPVHVRTESRGATMSDDRKERRMNWAMASKIRGAMTRTAVAASLIGMAFAGAVVPASADNAPTGPDDPACIADPTDAVCMGGPWGLPTSPSSVGCAIDPGQGICQGGPYDPAVAPPPPPPPTDPFGGMPGDIGAMHPDIGAMHPDIGALHPDIGAMHPGMGGMPGHI
jgi:hypothetical protein